MAAWFAAREWEARFGSVADADIRSSGAKFGEKEGWSVNRDAKWRKEHRDVRGQLAGAWNTLRGKAHNTWPGSG